VRWLGPTRFAQAFFRANGILRVDTMGRAVRVAAARRGACPPAGPRAVAMLTGRPAGAAADDRRPAGRDGRIVPEAPEALRHAAGCGRIERFPKPLIDLPMGTGEGGTLCPNPDRIDGKRLLRCA